MITKLMQLTVLLWAALLVTPTAWSEQWQVDHDQSKIGFVATYDDIPFEAIFKDFTVDVSFDPAALDQASFTSNVKIMSVDSESPDRDEGMLEPNWFDAAKHPQATFASDTFNKLDGEDAFTVSGDLRIKGVSRPVVFDFNFEAAQETARLKGQSLVKRTDFSIGTGDWAEDDTIGFDVQIIFDLRLKKKE